MASTIFGGNRAVATTLSNFAIPRTNISSNTATESIKAIPVRAAGTAHNMSVIVDANGTARAVVLRKNAADGIVISPTDSTAGTFHNSATTAHYAAGDTIDLQCRGTAPAYILSAIGCVFDADSGTAAMYGGNGTSFTTGPGFMSPGGIQEATEATAQFLVRAPATYSNMVASVTVGVVGSANVFNSRKNTAAGNMTFTVGSGLTGVFEDTTHSDSLVSGDKWNFSLAAGGTTGLGASLSVTAVCTTDVSEVPFNFAGSFSASNQFCGIWQGGTALTVTESTVALQTGVDGKFSNLRATLDVNTMTGSSSLVFRNGGVTGNQILTFGAGATGSFEDATHSDAITASNAVNFMFTGGTAGSLGTGSTAMTFTPLSFPGWMQALREPVRKRPGLTPGQQQFAALPDPFPFVPFGWFEPLSEPVRVRPGLRPGAQQFAAMDTAVIPVSRMMPWFAPLSEPARTRPGTHPSRQQFIAQDTQVIPRSLMVSWFAPLSEPARFRPGLAAARQQFLAAPSRLLPTPTTTGVMHATETKDTFLAFGKSWDRVTQGEVALTPHGISGPAKIINPAAPAGLITSARIGVRVVT